MEIFLEIVIALLFLQLAFVLWNAYELPLLEGRRPSAGPGGGARTAGRPSLSVLVPARDEAFNIGDCLRAVLTQSYGGPLEILVLDDESSDETASIVQRVAEADGRVRLLPGLPKPQGWTGKAYACHQLAQAARGEWMLFLDADARLLPGALERAMTAGVAQGGGLVTGFPHQRTGTWLERLVVPMMLFTVLCHLPVRYVRRSRDPKFAAAHGAFMFIHRAAYEGAGGHAAAASHLVDDMALARAVKRAGFPLLLADVHADVTMRMYRSAREVWNGYKKNVFPGVGRRASIILAVIVLYVGLYVAPAVYAVFALVVWSLQAAGCGASFFPAISPLAALGAFAAYGLGALIKGVVDTVGGRSPLVALALPASVLILIAIAASSWRVHASGRMYRWKGREYS